MRFACCILRTAALSYQMPHRLPNRKSAVRPFKLRLLALSIVQSKVYFSRNRRRV